MYYGICSRCEFIARLNQKPTTEELIGRITDLYGQPKVKTEAKTTQQ